MNKKRTSLDSIFQRAPEVEPPPPLTPPPEVRGVGKVAEEPTNRPGVKQQTAYLKDPIYEQLRRLAFEERQKMHDYLLEGLDLVFRKRGLPGVEELLKKEQSA